MRCIVQRLLAQQHTVEPGLYIPGELARAKLKLRPPHRRHGKEFHIYCRHALVSVDCGVAGRRL